jgi:hypothetical protein
MEGLVYDPINLEKVPINDYLNNDTNNIVIIHDNKYYGVNKSLFMFNNEMKRCIIKNGALLKKTTYDDPETFYNIGYFIGKKMIVNLKTLNSYLEKHRILELTSKSSGDTYINKELLELTTIGLLKQSENSIGKKNFKYAYEDVYFDELISNVLKLYAGNYIYNFITDCLLDPQLYNNNQPLDKYLTGILKKHLNIDGVIQQDFRKAIYNEIEKLDKAFIEAAPRYENKYKRKCFYRGMQTPYINTNGNELYNIGEKAHILNYASISLFRSVAKNFAGKESKATIYKIYLEEGLPYINMVSNAVLKSEIEYLLPRNIIFELISKKGNEYTVLAKPFKPDQFTIKTGCISLDYYDIVPTKLSASNAKKVPKFVFKDLGEKFYNKNTTDTYSYIKVLESKYKVINNAINQKQQKHFILLLGKPGAGKTHFIKHNLKEKLGLDEFNFINLNPDNLRYYNKDFVKEISGFLTKNKSSNGVNYIVNDKTIICYPDKDGNIVANIHATVNTLDDIRTELQNNILPYFLKSNKNIIYDSSCNDDKYCGTLLNNVNKQGYSVSIISVDAPNNIAFSRAKERQKSDGRFMSDDYLNSIYDNFDIKKKKNAIITYSGIPLKDYYKIIDYNTKSEPKEAIILPKFKRCPKGTVRDKVTNQCVPKNKAQSSKPTPSLNTAINKPKLGRCPKGTRRNPKTLLCEAKA